ADDVAAGRFELACFIRDRNRRGRLHTVERSGQERHHHLLANVANTPRVATDPRLFFEGSRHPKAGHAASQEAWPVSAQTFANVKTAPPDSRNIHKVLRRNDSYPARAA